MPLSAWLVPGLRCRACSKAVKCMAQRPYSSAPYDKPDTAVLLREIMRNVAQPVAVAVVSVPPSSPLSGVAKYHGATLTSFTSLTLHPRPLVAFSLRLPSRMADCLRPWGPKGMNSGHPKSATEADTKVEGAAFQLPPRSELPWPLSQIPMPEDPPSWVQSLLSQVPNPMPTTTPASSSPLSGPATRIPPTPLTISLLSTTNESIADDLSRPQKDHSSIFSRIDTWECPSASQPGHPPALKGCVGSLQCQVVGSVMLKDLRLPEDVQEGEGSEMFICRVVGVQAGTGEKPLLHWRRKYAGVKEFA